MVSPSARSGQAPSNQDEPPFNKLRMMTIGIFYKLIKYGGECDEKI